MRKERPYEHLAVRMRIRRQTADRIVDPLPAQLRVYADELTEEWRKKTCTVRREGARNRFNELTHQQRAVLPNYAARGSYGGGAERRRMLARRAAKLNESFEKVEHGPASLPVLDVKGGTAALKSGHEYVGLLKKQLRLLA